MSLRQEVEQAMGLRFPDKNGEALIQIEESMEIPKGAEALLRGPYRNPEELKRGFHTLHQETSDLLELLMPRRARIKVWLEQLPEQPKEAEKYLRESSELIKRHDRLVVQTERELLEQLAESGLEDLFPLPLEAFASVSYADPSVRIYLRPLGRVSEILKLNPEGVRQGVRVHFLYLLLFLSGQDLDGKTCKRSVQETVCHAIAIYFTVRHLRRQAQDNADCYQGWLKTWGSHKTGVAISDENNVEKVRAAMIFWRRNNKLNWEDAWDVMSKLDNTNSLPEAGRTSQGKFFD